MAILADSLPDISLPPALLQHWRQLAQAGAAANHVAGVLAAWALFALPLVFQPGWGFHGRVMGCWPGLRARP